MLPLFKLFSLTFRLVSRPLITFIKLIAANRDVVLFRDFFVFVGHRVHRIEIYINRKIANPKQSMDFYVKPLSSDKALSKGVESLIQYLFFYGALFTLGTYETKKAIDSTTTMKKNLARLENKTIENDLMLTALRKDFKDLETQLVGIHSSISTNIAQLSEIVQKEAGGLKRDNETLKSQIEAISKDLEKQNSRFEETLRGKKGSQTQGEE